MSATPDTPDDALAAQLRGFGPIGLLAALVVLLGNLLFAPLSAVLALVWRWRSRTPWREIGYVRPRSWLAGLAIGIVFGVAFKLAMKALVMPLLGANPVNQHYHFLAGNTAALPAMLFAIIVGAGWGEETVFRGFVFERMGRVFGSSVAAKTAIVLISSAWFAFAHYADQGLDGVKQAAIVGLAFGAIFARTGRLWMLMVAHAAFDLAALAMIYWNVEATIAHAVFK